MGNARWLCFARVAVAGGGRRAFVLTLHVSPPISFQCLIGVILTLGSHMLLAFTFLNPYVAVVIMGIAYSMVACGLWPMVAYILPESQLGMLENSVLLWRRAAPPPSGRF